MSCSENCCSVTNRILESRRNRICCGFLLAVGVVLTIILIPISLSSVEYYEYGLQKRRSGRVDTARVYGRGRYMLGPAYRFLHYPSDSHFEHFHELDVFSDGGSNESIGLAFKIDVDLTFLLIREEVGLLHQELASSYRTVIVSRAKDAIKNAAIFVPFEQYFKERKLVEERFREAVDSRWSEAPSLHCKLDQFHVGRIQIPDSVAHKQLESKVQNERNDKETFLQQATLERELTAVQVNAINLEMNKVLRTAEAEASLLRAKARAEADQIRANSQINGTQMLFKAAGIVTQDHMTAFSYIRTLKNRKNVDVDVSYLSADNVVRTTPV